MAHLPTRLVLAAVLLPLLLASPAAGDPPPPRRGRPLPPPPPGYREDGPAVLPRVRSASPAPATLVAGGEGFVVTLRGENLGRITAILALRNGLPAPCVTAALGPPDPRERERKVTFHADASCPAGTYTLRALTHRADFRLPPSAGSVVVKAPSTPGADGTGYGEGDRRLPQERRKEDGAPTEVPREEPAR